MHKLDLLKKVRLYYLLAFLCQIDNVFPELIYLRKNNNYEMDDKIVMERFR